MPLAHRLTVRIFIDPDGSTRARLTHFDATTKLGRGSYEFSGSSGTLFPELGSVLDAVIFSCLVGIPEPQVDGQLTIW